MKDLVRIGDQPPYAVLTPRPCDEKLRYPATVCRMRVRAELACVVRGVGVVEVPVRQVRS
jgi:hypothetical protein